MCGKYYESHNDRGMHKKEATLHTFVCKIDIGTSFPFKLGNSIYK